MFKYFSKLHPLAQFALIIISPILIPIVVVFGLFIFFFCVLFGVSVSYNPTEKEEEKDE